MGSGGGGGPGVGGGSYAGGEGWGPTMGGGSAYGPGGVGGLGTAGTMSGGAGGAGMSGYGGGGRAGMTGSGWGGSGGSAGPNMSFGGGVGTPYAGAPPAFTQGYTHDPYGNTYIATKTYRHGEPTVTYRKTSTPTNQIYRASPPPNQLGGSIGYPMNQGGYSPNLGQMGPGQVDSLGNLNRSGGFAGPGTNAVGGKNANQ